MRNPEEVVAGVIPAPSLPRPLLWKMIVEPLPPKEKTVGGIYIPEDTKSVQSVQTSIGRVLALGSKCFTAVSKAGIDFSTEPNKPRIGDYVIYGRHAGQRMERHDGMILILLDDTDVHAIVDDPDSFVRYI